MPTGNPLSEDLDYILERTASLWEELRGERLFVTGGTGFFGCWILESFLRANEKLDLKATATVLTRNLPAFEKKAPHLAAHPAVNFLSGDIVSFDFPQNVYKYLIHAAADVYLDSSPSQTIDAIFNGTRRVLEFAEICGAKKMLLTSSGAVYGKQPVSLNRVGEDYAGSPDPVNPGSAYGEGKRMAELLAAICARERGVEIKIARCFAFVGPYLQLDGHLAIGNFIGDALAGKPISIKGDGSPVRSYLYAADLMIWLWTILFRGKSAYPYNVGSEKEISLAELARLISVLAEKKIAVEIASQPSPAVLPERYVPQTRRALEDLHLRETIDLETAIKKTMQYFARAGSRAV